MSTLPLEPDVPGRAGCVTGYVVVLGIGAVFAGIHVWRMISSTF